MNKLNEKVAKFNVIMALVNIINGIICWRKFRLSNKNIFLFGIVISAIGATSCYYGFIFNSITCYYRSAINKLANNKEDDKAND